MSEPELLTQGCTKKKLRTGTIYFELSGALYAKECTKCNEIKGAGEFSKQNSSTLKVNPSCKQCQAAYRKSWAERNPEYDRKYTEENPDKVSDKNRRFREKNPEYQRDWYLRNKENADLYRKDWAARNPEWEIDYRRNYRLRRPEVSAITQSRRRAAEYGAASTLTTEEYGAVLDRFDHSCALTGEKQNLTIDHVVPLNITTVGNVLENVLPLNASVNYSKSGNNIFDWYSKNKRRFGIKERLFEDAIKYLASINGMSVEEYRGYVYKQHTKGGGA